MEIYVGFNNGKMLGSLQQGRDYEEKGDDGWVLSIKFFLNQGLKESDMVQVSEADYALYRQGYTRGDDGKPVAPVKVELTAEQKAATISVKYEVKFNEINAALLTAIRNDDVELQNELKAESAELTAQMAAELKGVE